MFYEVSKLLARICELVYDPQFKSKLEQQFILFFNYRGTSKILKDEIMGVLQYKRLNYVEQSRKKNITQKTGLVKSFKLCKNIFLNNESLKLWKYKDLLLIIKDLICRQELIAVIELLSHVYKNRNKQENTNTSKIVQTEINSCPKAENLEDIGKIFKIIMCRP